jgi:hypothetical protein
MISIENRVSGHISLHKLVGGNLVDGPAFTNLITDVGLDWVATAGPITAIAACRVGDGNTPPSVTDTDIENLVATSASSSFVTSNSGGVPVWFQSVAGVYTFAVGAIDGDISEVCFNTSGAAHMLSRALIKDALGNPTNFHVAGDEQLIVKYELRKYPPAIDATTVYSLLVDGEPQSHDVVIRAANVNDTSGDGYWYSAQPMGNVTSCRAYGTQTLGAVTSIPAGAASIGTVSLSGYAGGSFQRDMTLRWELGVGNFAAGVGSVTLGLSGATNSAYQISFDPPLPKDADSTMTLPVRVTWARA